MSAQSCDVLIVGLGPVGETLGGLLRSRGISVIAVDREADIYQLPRAGAFDEEAMRTFQMLGVSDILEPMTRTLQGMQFRAASGELLADFPAPPGGQYGWAWTYVLHQPSIERVLRARLQTLGAEIMLSTRLTSFEQTADGVIAQVEGLDGPSTIVTKYIVGCDGANSRVRQIIGSGEFDYGFSETWLVIDVIAEDGCGLPEVMTLILDPKQPTAYTHMLGDRYRWEFMLTPDEDPAAFDSDATVARLLAPWNPDGRLTLERKALYRFRGLVARDWRSGRALLAGDAAHLMPPFAGQGMCSGFRDASNLAWKLAAVIEGEAPDSLLDSYQEEREPHVREMIERSIDYGRMICVLDPEAATQRDAGLRAMYAAGQRPPAVPTPLLTGGCMLGGPASGQPFIQPVMAGRRLDDVLGAGPWLIARTPAPGTRDGLKRFSLASEAVGPFAAPLKAWLDEQDVNAVLVRPDRYVFGAGDADSLAAAWSHHLARRPLDVAAA